MGIKLTLIEYLDFFLAFAPFIFGLLFPMWLSNGGMFIGQIDIKQKFKDIFLFPKYIPYTKKELVRINWAVLAKFNAFMVFISFIRLALMDFKNQMAEGFIPPMPIQIDFWQLALVYWEDAFYAIPLYFLAKKLNGQKMWIWWTVGLAMSAWFASGHVYLGSPLWTAITFFYPIFISYRYGLMYGFGTVMIAHIMYDFYTLITAKLGPWLLF